jgi:hypothetical protein
MSNNIGGKVVRHHGCEAGRSDGSFPLQQHND